MGSKYPKKYLINKKFNCQNRYFVENYLFLPLVDSQPITITIPTAKKHLPAELAPKVPLDPPKVTPILTTNNPPYITPKPIENTTPSAMAPKIIRSSINMRQLPETPDVKDAIRLSDIKNKMKQKNTSPISTEIEPGDLLPDVCEIEKITEPAENLTRKDIGMKLKK